VTIATFPVRLIAAPLLAPVYILRLGVGCFSKSMKVWMIENVNDLFCGLLERV
jgi:hypothetical protein